MFPLYATSRLGFSQERAMSSYGLMLGLAFMMPALGGFAVSRLRSAAAPQRRVRIAQAALLCLCSGSLLFLVGSPNFTLVGAVLLTLGYGLFWPTVVTMVSDAYNVGESSTSTRSKRDDGFVIFYMVSTMGTFATQALAGPVVVRLDWTGFYVMLALAAVLGVVVLALATRRVTAVAIAGGAANKREALSPHEKRRVLGVLLLALFCLVFYVGCGLQSDGRFGGVFRAELCRSASARLGGTANRVPVGVRAVRGRLGPAGRRGVASLGKSGRAAVGTNEDRDQHRIHCRVLLIAQRCCTGLSAGWLSGRECWRVAVLLCSASCGGCDPRSRRPVDGYSLGARWLGGAAHGRVVRFDRTGGPARRVRRVRQFPCAEH